MKGVNCDREKFSPVRSGFLSAAGWVFVAAGTTFLFLVGFFILCPLSLVFEGASGNLPHRVSQFWARMIGFCLPFWTIQVEGLEKIKKGKPYVIVANHQSLLDILVLLAGLPLHFKFIARRELFWIPFFGWHLWLARYIPLKRGDPESGKVCLAKARSWVRRGVNVVFFPEGTRSPDGQIHEFKAGAFKLALEEKLDLLPVVIKGTREAMPKHSWYVEKRVCLRLQILEPVSVKGLTISDLDRLRETVRKKILSRFREI